MPTGDQVTIWLCSARAMYVGPALQLAPHRNVAATVAIGLEAPFHLRLGGQPRRTHRIALIPSGTRHHLQGQGAMAFLYLDPLNDGLDALTPGRLERARRSTPARTITAWSDALGLARRLVDPRLEAVVRQVDARPQDFTRAQQAADLMGVSTERFRHVFRQALGVPFRRYRLWRRMARVLVVLARGESLTHAAVEAGFASSAHLSSTFKAMFGLPPSALLSMGVRLRLDDGDFGVSNQRVLR